MTAYSGGYQVSTVAMPAYLFCCVIAVDTEEPRAEDEMLVNEARERERELAVQCQWSLVTEDK